MTLEEQISDLENILSSGTKQISIGDKTISYVSTDELYKIINQLKRKASGSNGWNITYMKQGSE